MGTQNAPARKSVAESPAVVQEEFSGYWFRLPTELDRLMELKPRALKVFLVIMRAIQRDKNGGKLSVRQIAARTGLTRRNAERGADEVVAGDLLERTASQGKTSHFRCPIRWKQKSDCPPTGRQNCPPRGRQHSEYSERRVGVASSPGHMVTPKNGKPQPSAPPSAVSECKNCEGLGWYKLNGKAERCSCEYGQELDQKVIDMLNKYQGKQGTRRPGQ